MSDGNRRSHVRKTAYTLLIMVFFLAVLFAIYMESPLAKVKAITIVGDANLDSSVLIRDSGIAVGENLFQLPILSAEERLLADFPMLADVSIRRDFFQQKVMIDVREREIAGLLEANGSFYTILADGTILQKDPTGIGIEGPILSTTAPLAISLGSKVTDPGLLALCKELPEIPQSERAELSELHVQTVDGREQIQAFSRDGFELLLPMTQLQRYLGLYRVIHNKLIAMGVAPGIIDFISSGQGVYEPYPKAGGKHS
ncbi:cell division protein FtsQ/DivIB [Sulfoacidibacillus thermotolerans]|uniref:POTRA domain-containing protein n=1 Tax=Sulfoacidibacillus thermotolerans TaxID=1765684 RepID=A0A2U3D8T7_SULT2|nr:FtsQ-type POTRA domain-containing protein [Sulfoacidibacillus thermotolerans]PWI57700.1 hypothetical protein BM613_06850 [Sulfoacidibacillus thermotolerans]